MARLTLGEILASDDEHGLLDVKLATSSSVDPTFQSFEEINLFIDRHGHIPGGTSSAGVSETSLLLRLNAIRREPDAIATLKEHDRHNLLDEAAPPEVTSLDDIFELDDDILTTDADDIFVHKHARPPSAKPDKVSERQRCEDFDFFEPIFDECAANLESGKWTTKKFANEQEIEAGHFFVLNGVLVYVAEVNDPHIRNGKRNARLRVIFDNGTEGANLLRSLATELYKDPNGRRVITHDHGSLFIDQPQNNDTQTGMIYVLRSLSDNPQIKRLDGNLFKIGFTSGKMETRIQYAADDPTFLMAAVAPVKTYALYNIDKVKLENLLHKFFSNARLDIEIPDRFGKVVRPREWFLLPLTVIDEAVARLVDGSIIGRVYDARLGQIVRVSSN